MTQNHKEVGSRGDAIGALVTVGLVSLIVVNLGSVALGDEHIRTKIVRGLIAVTAAVHVCAFVSGAGIRRRQISSRR